MRLGSRVPGETLQKVFCTRPCSPPRPPSTSSLLTRLQATKVRFPAPPERPDLCPHRNRSLCRKVREHTGLCRPSRIKLFLVSSWLCPSWAVPPSLHCRSQATLLPKSLRVIFDHFIVDPFPLYLVLPSHSTLHLVLEPSSSFDFFVPSF